MKSSKFLILAVLLIAYSNTFGQPHNYDAGWKKVDDLVHKKNLPRSALAEVKKIYALAKQQKNDVQVIRSLVYLTGLQEEIREDNTGQSIAEIEKEIIEAREPARSILKSLLATVYWQYLQENRYRFYDRTNTKSFIKKDIATWTAPDLHSTISELYLQSLHNSELLKQTRLEKFDALIIKGNSRNLRPTLYDLLAHKALEYFKNDEPDILRPSFAFEINRPEAYDPAPQFVQHTFATRDSLSLQHKALQVFRDLIAFHLNDAQGDALIDVDLERIQFVHNKATVPGKDQLYTTALERIIASAPANPVTDQASFLLAAFYNNLASRYDPLSDTTHRYDRVKAKQILENVIRDSTVKTEGWLNSFQLLQQIMQSRFSFELEKVNLPDQPFRALVNYTNIGHLKLRLVKPKELTRNRGYANDDKFWETLVQLPPVRTWEQVLPQTGDHQEHSVEIKIDGLPAGEYLLLASADERFEKKNNPLAQQLFYVSNISLINNRDEFFVLHRETGRPLAGALAQIWTERYHNQTHTYTREKHTQYKADTNGYFKLINKKNDYTRQFYFELTYQNDRLYVNDPFYALFTGSESPDTTSKSVSVRTYLFTDRGLYRPGQTIYFKGISVVGSRSRESKIQQGFKSTIYLGDANEQVLDSMMVTTNEYGSFNGRFRLPVSLLNGSFSVYMKDDGGDARIQVEEYKRPKFIVAFDTIQESYQVNDTVAVSGNVKAYAGNLMQDATVHYRVVRNARFPYAWLRGWYPESSDREITHGETRTDAAGKFSIRFPAIPDNSIRKESAPVFDYQVFVDVTDISGETRSRETTISAGYQSIILKLELPEKVALDSFRSIAIRTENMNGKYQSTQVTVAAFKLVPEQRLIRKRLWKRPDQFLMTKEEFVSLFPHDEYAHETEFKSWTREKQVYTVTAPTQINGRWIVESPAWTSGFYAIEVTAKDPDGKEVKEVRYVELFDEKDKSLTKPEYLWTKSSFPIEPGQKTSIGIGSSADIFLVSRKDQPSQQLLPQYGVLRLRNEKINVDLSASEADRGGYGMSFFFVRDNRLYSFNDIISVPWNNKDLQIAYTTFRDKTLPGSSEKWSVKISGNKKEAVAAEMLAAMYDASLDQFYFHKWDRPDIWTNYSGGVYWNQNNFHAVTSMRRWIKMPRGPVYVTRVDDRLAFHPYELAYGTATRGVRAQVGDLQQARWSIAENGEGVQEVTINAPASLSRVSMSKFTPPVMMRDEEQMREGVSTDTAYLTAAEKMRINQDNNTNILPRKNFNETAFFFPDLKTDTNGSIEFSFTAPETLTSWKLQTLAHTKELAFGSAKKEMITQKELMVQPALPRFLRQGDHIEITAKIVNLSGHELTGQVQLELFDQSTNQSVDGWMMNTFPNQYFTVSSGKSELVRFPVQVPMQFSNPLTWRITARSGNFSDAEEDVVPVLTNKVLVKETVVLSMRGSGSRNLAFDKLANAGNSETLQHHSLTVEYTSNPAWYAVLALPYLMEFPYECAEQTWNRYYANALAGTIANSGPRIKALFDRWKNLDTTMLLSNLQKNPELKSVVLQETPWVLDAQSEEQQRKNIALLFDVQRMTSELGVNMSKLKQQMNDNGSFSWFKGGQDDRFITQYILTGIGHLKKLKAMPKTQEEDLQTIIMNGLNYLDRKTKEDYDRLIKQKANLTRNQLSDLLIYYLYMRSFFPEKSIPKSTQAAWSFFKKQAQLFWKSKSKYLQGMTAIALYRAGDVTTAQTILKSLKETAIYHEELGMYWKENRFGDRPYWSDAPIETQALMIEAFIEITRDTKTADDLRTWLLKNKQTNNWSTTKATADACYAVLLHGTNWLVTPPAIQIDLGTKHFTGEGNDEGSGYFKKTVDGNQIDPAMGSINLQVQQQPGQPPVSSWGAVYWQYFEEMDKVTPAATPLRLDKKLFIEKNSENGPVLIPVADGAALHIGEKVKVRIELKVDRDLEYVHMKDMRASAFEPANVLSGYRWQGALGYYETTKDASTSFFFDQLRKGTYVFEYPLFVTHAGSFSNGLTTIQCMYAPEFSAHSKGIRVEVE